MVQQYLFKDLDWYPSLADKARAVWIERIRKIIPDLDQSSGEWKIWKRENYQSSWDILSIVSESQVKAVVITQTPPDLSSPGVSSYVEQTSWPFGKTGIPLSSMSMACPLTCRELGGFGKLLSRWVAPDTTYQLLKNELERINTGRELRADSERTLFSDFYSSSRVLQQAQLFWENLVVEYTTRNRCGWKRWRDPSGSGNPMLCYYSESVGRAIRIIQRQDFSWKPLLDVWIEAIDYTVVGGPSIDEELTISVVATSRTVEMVRELIVEWVKPGTTAEDIESRVQKDINLR